MSIDAPAANALSAAPTVPDTGIDEFSVEVRAFLDANATRRSEGAGSADWGHGIDRIAYFSADSAEVDRINVDAAKAWQKKRFDAGLGWITGPAEFGGRALSTVHDMTYDLIELDYDVADTGVLSVIGLGMIGPTILAHAQDDVRQQYLPAMYSGDVIACQLFSEPDAGSGRPDHSRSSRWRRLGDRRAEGLDVGGPALGNRHAAVSHRPGPAQAPGHHGVPDRHGHARCRGAAAAPDDRRR